MNVSVVLGFKFVRIPVQFARLVETSTTMVLPAVTLVIVLSKLPFERRAEPVRTAGVTTDAGFTTIVPIIPEVPSGLE